MPFAKGWCLPDTYKNRPTIEVRGSAGKETLSQNSVSFCICLVLSYPGTSITTEFTASKQCIYNKPDAVVKEGAMEILFGALQWLGTVAGGVSLLLVGLIGIWHGPSLVRRARRRAVMACSIDADCPPGYVCVGGVCVPATAE